MEEYNLSPGEALILANNHQTSSLLKNLVKEGIAPEIASKWIIGPVKGLVKQTENVEFYLSAQQLGKLIALVHANKVTYKNAVESVLPELVKNLAADTEKLVAEMNLVVDDDKSSLSIIIDEIFTELPGEVDAFKNGKKALLQLFMGQVMKKTKGKADPKITMKLIKDKLG